MLFTLNIVGKTDFEDMITDPEFWVIILLLSFAVCIISLIVSFVARKSQEASDNAQPINTAYAKVVEKQSLPSDAIILSSTLIWFLFETKDGRRLRLNAKAQCGLVVGDTGLLTWQGSRVRNFEREINNE